MLILTFISDIILYVFKIGFIMTEIETGLAPESKRINFSIIILGIIFVFIAQTWISVLNAQQAYGMNEARIAEAKVARVADRLEEIANFFRSPELVYFYAMNEGYHIVLTPESLKFEGNQQVWGYSNEILVEDKYLEATNFINNVDSMLPDRGKRFFVPFRESIKGTPLGSVFTFFENSVVLFQGFRQEGLNISWDRISDINTSTRYSNDLLNNNEEILSDVYSDSSVQTVFPVETGSTSNNGGLIWDEKTNSYRIPSPITR